MNDREYWRPHVRSKKFPAIRYAVASMPISPGSFIKITCRGEKPTTTPELISYNSELENELPNKLKGSIAALPASIRKNRLPEHVRMSDSRWLRSVRSVPVSPNRLREMPGIFVSPAPKYARKSGRGNWNSTISSKTYYHRSTHQMRNDTRRSEEQANTLPPEIPTQSQTVTIPALSTEGLNENASEERNSVASPLGVGIADTLKAEKMPLRESSSNHAKFYPNLVNLNQNFIDISSRLGGKVALNVALSRKFVAGNRSLENGVTHFNPRSRNQPPMTASPRFLPLREVYLKGALTENKEPASYYQEDKVARIRNWLKKLNYLDESKLVSNNPNESTQ